MASKRRVLWRTLAFAASLCLANACAGRKGIVHPEINAAADGGDVLALSDALEALIADGKDTPADREHAYAIVRTNEQDTAAARFARADITGRLVQHKGLRAARLVGDIERCARRSREIDPNFRNGAATRLLGMLYVIAPARLLQYGNSEDGVDLLEGLVAAHPETPENHLRLAEAYITLGDPTPAYPHLCFCVEQKGALRHDEQLLLSHLIADAGTLPCEAPR